jgi:LysR family transcriptional regulator, hydrogen peroxide-inducible genes activator
MTLNELRYMVAVADQRHFGKAASACCVSQPTLSTQIKKLEAQLGVTLFERTNKSVRPTPIGEKVVRKARKILDQVEDIRTMCRGLMRPLCGARTLGVIPTLAPYLLPRLLPPMRARYPELELIVVEDITERLIGRLTEHSLDMAAVALPAGQDDLIEIPMFDEPFLVACPADHRLASAEAIGLEQLRKESILYLADGHCLREQALAICEGAADGHGQREDFRATSLETLRHLVAAGLGFTLLPALAIPEQEGEPAGIVVRPFAGPASRRIGLVCRQTYPHADELGLLAGAIVDHLPGTVSPIARAAIR